jgi:hypothetical protein
MELLDDEMEHTMEADKHLVVGSYDQVVMKHFAWHSVLFIVDTLGKLVTKSNKNQQNQQKRRLF